MRPVNLIPPEDRRGDRAPLRKGSLSYLVVAGLAAVLIAVTMVVLTNNTIADRESEIASLEVREDAARERAESLAAFAEFRAVSDARATTVASLAESRFDWYRVLEELSRLIPDDVTLTSLTGNVSSAVAVGENSELRAGSEGPALSMLGCAKSHDAVAAFLEDLKDIDGVTRVGISKSTIGSDDAEGGSSGPAGATDECSAVGSLAEFDVVAVFDGVPVASAEAAPTTSTATTTTTSTEAPPADSSIEDATAQEEQARKSIEKQSKEARDATNIVPGVAR